MLTYASVARLLRFKPLLPDEKLPSFDKKMSLCASVGLWIISITLLSLTRTYWRDDCLLVRAKLFISRCKSVKWDRRNGSTLGLSGKFVASWTAIWNSSIDNPPLFNYKFFLCANLFPFSYNLLYKPYISMNYSQLMTKPTSEVDHQHQHLYLGQTEPVPRETFLFSANADCHELTMN